MRPITLELTGFGTFRNHTEVGFDDANYFAFVGPTGSGKSTIIDAICFALYGSVPRYENENLVAPVISQGGLEAKVRLDFSIGPDTYTAVRVVRRSGKGATTKEARLERDGQVLAGTADEVTDEVKRLVGLSFNQFTKCVVLPQGEFARFLHDKPAARQDLLVRLLNLDVYERMRYLASQRAAEAKSKAAVLEQRLEQDLSFATEDALNEATARSKRVDALRGRVAQAMPALKDLESRLAEARSRLEEDARWIEIIDGLELPAEVAELSAAVKDAGIAVKAAEKEAAAARKAVAVATKARAALPERDPLLKVADAHERKERVEKDLADATKARASAEATREKALAALRRAEDNLAAAVAAQKQIETDHAAHHIAANLKKGEPCPVCAQVVTKVPRRAAPKAVATVAREVTQAEAAVADVRERADEAAHELTRWTSQVELAGREIESLVELVAAYPKRTDLDAQLEAIAAADDALENARDDERAAYDSLDEIRKIANEVIEREADARSWFATARDQLVSLGAPAAGGKDLASDWQALISWAGTQRPRLEKSLAEAAKTSETAAKARAALVDELEASCRDCEIDLDGRDLLDVVSAAQARATAEVERIAKAIADAQNIRTDLIDLQREHDLANGLAHHLSARGFEKWLVNEAVRRLVVGASEILGELSGGQYAITIDDTGNFLVTDHHNADEQRSARTLSGGETFLASLSLALALADQLAELATKGAARLDAIFLDEGFGTLDPETLDTVAATVENLAARGRMVGVVTHVRELAERVPVQFRVKKDLRGSTVERVNA
ncbi:MAG TPA: SMC family ATPase [Actinomycetota bacterium]|nr:SMC family ATPase [Actinomycetota bacterium]